MFYSVCLTSIVKKPPYKNALIYYSPLCNPHKMLFQSTAIDLYIYNRFFFFFILCKQRQQCFSDIIRFHIFRCYFLFEL